ncbi:hypothetical protein AB0T83_06495 [Fluviibacterium sp. DFM31]|uniref:Uncharacterized protein n=1 Tax=Meridianimarinicoccus marinus TaxID=3231483 RepID=A0ABV3L4F3_9RHOB
MTATPDHPTHSQRWTGTEFRTLLLAVLALATWGGAIALFGFAGLIVPALALVGVMALVLVMISRG